MTLYESAYREPWWDEDDEDVGTVEDCLDALSEGEPFEEDGGEAWAIREYLNEHPQDFTE